MAEIVLYFLLLLLLLPFLFLWLRFLHQLAAIFLSIIFFFLLLQFLLQAPAQCLLVFSKDFFPSLYISTFELSVKNVRHTYGIFTMLFCPRVIYSTREIHFSTYFFFLPFIYFLFIYIYIYRERERERGVIAI